MSGVYFLHLVIWFLYCVSGKPLDRLAPESKEACVPGSHVTVAIEGTVSGRLPLPGYCTDSRLKHTPSLSEEEDYLHVQELWPEKQAFCPFGSLQDAYGGAVREWRPVDATAPF